MNDPSSEQRPVVSPLLKPTDTSTLKQLCLQENATEFVPFNEYQLNGKPESLKAFVDQFLKKDGTYDGDRLIWTSKNSCVRARFFRHKLPGVYQNHRFYLELKSGSRYPYLFIHSSSLEDAMSCLDLLVGLHDDHYEEIGLIIQKDGPPILPLTCGLLDKFLLQNAKRKNKFDRMTFTPDQSRTLATSGTRTDIELSRCKFEDDGEAFLEALVEREDSETGLAKLRIGNWLPVAEGILVLFPHTLKCLILNHIRLKSEEACRAVAEAELQYLELSWCQLGDGGASLVESVREGRGPKGLRLLTWGGDNWHPFDSSERFVSFLNALRGNTYLKRLLLPCFNSREAGVLAVLAAALFENKGLVHLNLQNCHLDESCFCEFSRAIATHPSLRTLDLTCRNLGMDATEESEEVAKMLSDNSQLEEVRVRSGFSSSFDSLAWAALVTPRLECNVYRKRFPAIQEIRVPSTRAAVLANALAHVSNKPSPAFMLLRENGDILISYSCVESQSATSSGKRSRSPSSGGMVVWNVGPP
jgi:hypothetical protein